MLVCFIISITFLTWFLVFLIINILKKRKIRAFEIFKIIVIIILVSSISLLFKYKYICKIDLKNTNIDKIQICWDDCVIVDIAEEEENIIREELSKYYFSYDNDYFSVGWNGENESSTIASRTVIITLNETQIIYDYNKFNDKIYRYLTYKKNNKYYTKSGSNRVTNILDKYIILYQDSLNKKNN